MPPSSQRVFVLGFVLLLLAAPALAAQPTPPDADKPVTAQEILDYVDDMWRGESSHGVMTMTITTENWERSLTVEVWSEGKENSLLKILAPKKEEGMTTLKSGNNIWNYLPKIKRVIKLPSSMMGDSWMGSHFTNDDLVKESRMTEDYDFEVTFQGERDGKQVVEITCLPKPEAVVVWGKLKVLVDRQAYLPIRSDYYDEAMNLARTMIFSDVAELGGRRLPRRMEIRPASKPDESTVVVYEKMEFNLDLPDQLFSIRSLTR